MSKDAEGDDQMDIFGETESAVTSEKVASGDLPPVPSKHWFSIGEVANLCQVRSHVLRYWEQEFTGLNPTKRRGNRRYYSNADVLLARRIRDLLYDQGYTIAGARALLESPDEKPAGNSWIKQELQSLRQEIRAISRLLED